MKDKEKGFMLRGFSIPLTLVFLLLLNLFSGCAAAESFAERFELAGFSKKEEKTDGDLLTLVNPWNPMDADYVPTLSALSDGTQVDARCIEALRELLTACREAGHAPYVCSGYRTWDTQSYLFENKVSRLIEDGMDEATAREKAATEVAFPGTSEHQLGLAVDIIDSGYTALDEGQAATATQRWLMDNSWRYGFILRYPEDKSELTGIIYEPWHYRYVGRESAADIYESGLCLEEWLETK